MEPNDTPVTPPVEPADRPFGPTLENGSLKFTMQNGSAMICRCIKPPFSTMIFDMLKEWKNVD